MRFSHIRKAAVPFALAVAAGAVPGTLATSTPAAAVVYCTGPGVPAGCVVRRPAPAVAYCTAPGVPVGCVARPAARTPGVGLGAPGVGVRPGVGLNAGGPVNRRGVR
ncbi:hypothetical protein [Acuticoccus mangrovi]|uniref:Uncharacterized protein n=1 Tax=Acuticoccus mangrovi TaxID=2796142 RepID=A0A934IR25_9HYPH|nr:hypothetical protein [Acuticoccus mangrovi]MBJ3776707.1 hypothetical protein [Acuticoccus mangrovi]